MERMLVGAFALAGVLAAAAAIVEAPAAPVSLDTGALLGLKGLVAALVVGFYLVMFTPAELPLVGYALAPARTTALVDRLNAWFDHNGRRVAVVALELGGAYLIVRGSIALI